MKKYSEEFKAEAVRLALESGMSQCRVARDLGVNTNPLLAGSREPGKIAADRLGRPLNRRTENSGVRMIGCAKRGTIPT